MFDGVAEFQEPLTRAMVWHALIRSGAFDQVNGGRVGGASPLIYIDKNPWGRALDDLSISRNQLEADAFEALREVLHTGAIRLAYSDISFGEGMPRTGATSASQVALRGVVQLGMMGLPLIFHDERYDTTLVRDYLSRNYGIRGADGLHAAASLLEGVWYFVSGDDRLVRRLNAIYSEWRIPVAAGSPVEALGWITSGTPI